MSELADIVGEPRVKLFDRLAQYDDFRALVGGPLPSSAGAKIALVEHLWADPQMRFEIRRITRRAFPYAYIPRESNDSLLRRTVHKIVRALRAPSNVGRAPADAAARHPQGASGP